jgi:Fe-S-cluster-containing dehydrogenase component/CRP-like cAMP-binding protein
MPESMFESIQRPERWAVPFSTEMTDEVVDRLLAMAPFDKIDPQRFRGKVTLRGILQNDTCVTRYHRGEIIVRQGDWGNSAFLIASGTVRAGLGVLPSEILGRRKIVRKGLFQSLAQLWRRPSDPEVRDVGNYRQDPRLGQRGSGRETRVFLQDISMVLDEFDTAQMLPGQLFGEQAALGRTPRQSTVFAEEETEVVEIRWQGLRDLMRRDTGIQEHVDQVFRERALQSFLLSTPLFQHLNKDELKLLVEKAEFDVFGQFDWAGSYKQLVKKGADTDLAHEPLIAEEGSYPNGVVIVRSGLARLSQRVERAHRTVAYLTPGQVYAFDEMREGWRNSEPSPLKYSLRAIGIATVVVIPTPIVESLLLEASERGANSIRTGSVNSPPGRPVADLERVNPDFVEFLVQKRYVNGTATMLIDLDRCTRCDDCVRACADTHDGNPRFVRQGPVQNNVMVANACMHCEDPVCMIECPTGAIHRNVADGEVVINDHTCIGCGACANHCPYDAIRMVEVRHAGGDFVRDEQNHLPIVKATKCDLCADQWGGPACQRACPHDALIRMDMGDLVSLSDWCDR